MAERITPSQLVRQLYKKFTRGRKEDTALPQPIQELFEIQKILASKGLYMAPFVYRVGEEKISHALVDTSGEPLYDKGLQMYEKDIRKDGRNGPLAEILARGRDNGDIAVPCSLEHVPRNSRFAVSRDEINNYVALELAKKLAEISRYLAARIASGAQLRLRSYDEYKQTGKFEGTHPGRSNIWEWLCDDYGDVNPLVSSISNYGGINALFDWRYGNRYDDIAFRFQLVMPPQMLR